MARRDGRGMVPMSLIAGWSDESNGVGWVRCALYRDPERSTSPRGFYLGMISVRHRVMIQCGGNTGSQWLPLLVLRSECYSNLRFASDGFRNISVGGWFT